MLKAHAGKAISGIEMRSAPRRLILQRCFVRLPKAAAHDAWRCIAYNISASGIGVALPKQLPEGTLLTIQAWGLPQARTLQVRIVRTKQVEFFWFTGCELIKRLSDDDFRIWCSGPIDWLDHSKHQ